MRFTFYMSPLTLFILYFISQFCIVAPNISILHNNFPIFFCTNQKICTLVQYVMNNIVEEGQKSFWNFFFDISTDDFTQVLYSRPHMCKCRERVTQKVGSYLLLFLLRERVLHNERFEGNKFMKIFDVLYWINPEAIFG